MKKIISISLILLIVVGVFVALNSIKIPAPSKLNQYNLSISDFI